MLARAVCDNRVSVLAGVLHHHGVTWAKVRHHVLDDRLRHVLLLAAEGTWQLEAQISLAEARCQALEAALAAQATVATWHANASGLGASWKLARTGYQRFGQDPSL